mmetsp:Transcript_31171/g.56557  ORF Transcript_31171/g.56557 Transcript_31171/m.56557 type:complete len:106 (+) Transcript_31171:145-462(+)
MSHHRAIEKRFARGITRTTGRPTIVAAAHHPEKITSPTFHSHHSIPPIINSPALRSYTSPRPPTTSKKTGGVGQSYQKLHASTSQINWKNSDFLSSTLPSTLMEL